ncbi:MAG: molybdenum cofactor guanylyltransferase [Longimicrobiales bacterium]|nr:molybdenum cofactor guanylyltransferase [Longimicrobiales bacterium]
MATARLLGAVLAGGRSRRYGSDKSNALVGGRLLVERSISALEQVVEEVVVVTSRQLPDSIVVPCIPDRFVDAGPLGGLHAALHTAVEYGSSGVLLLACDMPLITPEVLRAVAVAMDQRPAVAPLRDEGIEPLCAAYHIDTLQTAEDLLLGNDLSLHRFFKEVGGRPIDLEAMGMECGNVFFNVNEQADCIRADALLTGSP